MNFLNDLKNNVAMLVRFSVAEVILVLMLLSNDATELAIAFIGLTIWYAFDVSVKLGKLEKVSGWKRYQWLDTAGMALVLSNVLVWGLKALGAEVSGLSVYLKDASIVTIWFSTVVVFINYTWLYMKNYTEDNDGGYEDTDFDDGSFDDDDDDDDCEDIMCANHPDYDYNRGFNDGYDNGLDDMQVKATAEALGIAVKSTLEGMMDGYELGYEDGLKDGFGECVAMDEMKKKTRKATKKVVRQSVRKPKKAKK